MKFGNVFNQNVLKILIFYEKLKKAVLKNICIKKIKTNVEGSVKIVIFFI